MRGASLRPPSAISSATKMLSAPYVFAHWCGAQQAVESCPTIEIGHMRSSYRRSIHGMVSPQRSLTCGCTGGCRCLFDCSGSSLRLRSSTKTAQDSVLQVQPGTICSFAAERLPGLHSVELEMVFWSKVRFNRLHAPPQNATGKVPCRLLRRDTVELNGRLLHRTTTWPPARNSLRSRSTPWLLTTSGADKRLMPFYLATGFKRSAIIARSALSSATEESMRARLNSPTSKPCTISHRSPSLRTGNEQIKPGSIS